MEKKKEREPKPNNKLIESFKHKREKGSIMFRVLATVLDFVIIAFLCQLMHILFGIADVETYLQMQDVVAGLAKDAPEVIERTRLWNKFLLEACAIGAAYGALQLVTFNATIGKLVFGFRLTPYKEDRNIILSKLLLALRPVVVALSIYIMSAIPYIILCLTVYGNAEARSGFDVFSGTKMIHKGWRRNK